MQKKSHINKRSDHSLTNNNCLHCGSDQHNDIIITSQSKQNEQQVRK